MERLESDISFGTENEGERFGEQLPRLFKEPLLVEVPSLMSKEKINSLENRWKVSNLEEEFGKVFDPLTIFRDSGVRLVLKEAPYSRGADAMVITDTPGCYSFASEGGKKQLPVALKMVRNSLKIMNREWPDNIAYAGINVGPSEVGKSIQSINRFHFHLVSWEKGELAPATGLNAAEKGKLYGNEFSRNVTEFYRAVFDRIQAIQPFKTLRNVSSEVTASHLQDSMILAPDNTLGVDNLTEADFQDDLVKLERIMGLVNLYLHSRLVNSEDLFQVILRNDEEGGANSHTLSHDQEILEQIKSLPVDSLIQANQGLEAVPALEHSLTFAFDYSAKGTDLNKLAVIVTPFSGQEGGSAEALGVCIRRKAGEKPGEFPLEMQAKRKQFRDTIGEAISRM